MTEEEFVNYMARVMFVDRWAMREEERGRNFSGVELMDVAPKRTPKVFVHEAWKLLGALEERNRSNLYSLFAQAMIADGVLSRGYSSDEFEEAFDEWGEEFAFGIAMSSMGHGVSWEDDHAAAGIDYPEIEAPYDW